MEKKLLVLLMTISVLLLRAAGSIVVGDNINEALKEGGKEGIIHVGGKVLCQDCSEGWNQWVTGAKPLQGCKVSVTCLDKRSRVVYYGSDLTDEAGDFEMIINKQYSMNARKVFDAKNCFLRLVSSPDPVCNIATDFAGGKTGVKLFRPTVVYRDIIKYVLEPFYYTTPMCDEPDDHDTKGNVGDDGSDDEDAKKTNY